MELRKDGFSSSLWPPASHADMYYAGKDHIQIQVCSISLPHQDIAHGRSGLKSSCVGNWGLIWMISRTKGHVNWSSRGGLRSCQMYQKTSEQDCVSTFTFLSTMQCNESLAFAPSSCTDCFWSQTSNMHLAKSSQQKGSPSQVIWGLPVILLKWHHLFCLLLTSAQSRSLSLPELPGDLSTTRLLWLNTSHISALLYPTTTLKLNLLC